MMPGMDGYQVCRELQFGYTKDIPVVFLTAKSELAHMMEANRSGASAFITKPFRTEHLLQTVRDVLRDASVYYDEITGLPTLANVQVEVQRLLADHNQLGIIYISLEGIHALEELEGFEVVDDVFRVVGERLSDSRGELLRGEDFISISSLGNAFLVVLSPAREQGYVSDERPGRDQGPLEDQPARGPRGGAAPAPRGQDRGLRRAGRASRSRRRCASSAPCSPPSRRPPTASSARSNESRHRLHARVPDASSPRSRSPASTSPSCSLSDYAVIGYELLARGPLQSELHRPDVLFEVARDQGRVPELDRLCRMMAARASSTLPDQYLRFINTEPVNLFFHARSDLFVHELVAATPAHLRGKTIIEVTEKSIIEDFERVREVVAKLREQGFRIAIDDAGAGYSGLADGGRDRARLHEARHEPAAQRRDLARQAAAHRHAARLLPGSRHHLVAEGIETAEQLEMLRRARDPLRPGLPLRPPGLAVPAAGPHRAAGVAAPVGAQHAARRGGRRLRPAPRRADASRPLPAQGCALTPVVECPPR